MGPLAATLQIPFLLAEEEMLELALRYYPFASSSFHDFSLARLASDFDLLIESRYFQPHLKALFWDLHRKKMHLVFCPHGQSDKGLTSALLAPYATQDIVLHYGPLMLEMLAQQGIYPQKRVQIGNFRHAFYLAHKSFYDRLAEEEIFSGLSKGPTILYAPTWRDAEDSSSFFQIGREVVKQLPEGWNLIYKVHPLLPRRDAPLFYRLTDLAASHPRVRLVSTFPPVYPILDRVDAYLGDGSSVGYDFLLYEKPMFFFSSRRSPLHACGQTVDQKQLFSTLESSLQKEKRALYLRAFGPSLSARELSEAIQKAARDRPDSQ